MIEKVTKEELIKAMDDYIEACNSRGFHEKTLDAFAIIAGSEEGISKSGGTTLLAFKKLLELVENSNDEQDFINAACVFFGVGK